LVVIFIPTVIHSTCSGFNNYVVRKKINHVEHKLHFNNTTHKHGSLNNYGQKLKKKYGERLGEMTSYSFGWLKVPNLISFRVNKIYEKTEANIHYVTRVDRIFFLMQL